MTSLLRIAVLIPLCVAERPKLNLELEPQEQDGGVDVSQFAQKAEIAYASSKLRCCCDSESSRGLLNFNLGSTPAKSGLCTFVESPTCSKTGTKFSTWYKNRKDGRGCLMETDNIEQTFKKYPLNDYCVDDEQNILALDGTTTAKCRDIGDVSVKCVYDTAIKGRYSVDCMNWCDFSTSNEEYYSGTPWLQPVQMYEEFEVFCTYGTKIDKATVVCNPNRTLSPHPECTFVKDYCKLQNSPLDDDYGASAGPAYLSQQVPVTCWNPGYIPTIPMVTCQPSTPEKGFFDSSLLRCQKEDNFCAKIEPRTSDFVTGMHGSVPSGQVGDTAEVTCHKDHQQTTPQTLRCGEDKLWCDHSKIESAPICYATGEFPQCFF